MNFARTELLSILPPHLREQLHGDNLEDLEEIRLRLNSPPELVRMRKSYWNQDIVTEKDIQYCINAASRYSPWAASTAALGYITAPGGHRIGICGEMVSKDGIITGVRRAVSLCIRVAKDYPGVGKALSSLKGSVLILGAPGSGKTTLMRDLIRHRSDSGVHISVADERGELFPGEIFPQGKHTDVMSGCAKATALEILVRTMGPDCIAVDEITSPEDCDALIRANNCGVSLLATAHGSSIDDLYRRRVYAPLVQNEVFKHIVLMRSDKSWRLERSRECSLNGSVRF